MATDPTTLFITAALAAGLVEGTSVLRHHKVQLQQQQTNDNIKKDEEVVAPEQQHYVPSVPLLAIHSMVYGFASVPLGIIGASPGHIFLPKSFTISVIVESDEADAVKVQDATKISDMDISANIENDDKSFVDNNPPISNTQVVGTGRNFARLRRTENSKMIHNRRQTDKSINTKQTHPRPLIAKPPTNKYPMAPRYIATLDGMPLPTPLAEAMRRSRLLFLGAGLVSYVMSTYTTTMAADRQKQQQEQQYAVIDYLYNVDDRKWSRGYYDRYWMDGKSISLWNERIKKGKSMNEEDLLKQLLLQTRKLEQKTEMMDGSSILRDITSKVLSSEYVTYLKRAVYDGGLCNISKWMNQLTEEKGEAKQQQQQQSATISFINNTEYTSNKLESAVVENGKVNNQGGTATETESGVAETTKCDKDDETDSSESPPANSQSKPTQSPNIVWSAAVTSVDVLGTSIRHLLESTVRVATAVATVGRRGHPQRSEKDDDKNGLADATGERNEGDGDKSE